MHILKIKNAWRQLDLHAFFSAADGETAAYVFRRDNALRGICGVVCREKSVREFVGRQIFIYKPAAA